MTDQLEDQLHKIKSEAAESIAKVTNEDDLEIWRIRFLGRKGSLPLALKKIKDLPESERGVVGQAGNEVRAKLQQLFQAKKIEVTPEDAEEAVDTGQTKTTLHSIPKKGSLHPITLTIRSLQQIFSELGFVSVTGPQVEESKYNFDYLNIPLEHPSRDETDTFYLTNDHILRTHTSAVQVRAVLEHDLNPPFSILSIGRVYRAERTDATHETTFHQFEGVMVGEDVTIADFKGTIEIVYGKFFGQDVKTRLRPAFFPFVEPGFEVDISCTFCQQKGCRVCKYTGWIEMMGAGLVHPNVLKNMNVNATEYQGFAFGGAIDRLAMLRYGINDIRLFWAGDLRFLTQFS